MQIAHPARHLAANTTPSRTARMQGRVRRRLGRDALRRDQRLDVTLDVKKIRTALVLVPLLRQRAAERECAYAQRLRIALAGPDKAAANFENADALLLAIDVGTQRLEQSSQQCRAHDIQVA